MTVTTRSIGAVVLGLVWTTAFALAQTTAPPAPQGQTQAPPPQGQAPPAAQGQPPPGGRRGGYTQFTRPLASPDVILRGKALYETNCASCHAVDLRGTADGKY
jgi:mono/diheme cytochrome c family protein